MMGQVNLIKISNLDYLNNSKFLKKRTWHTIKYKRFFKFFKKTVFLLFYFYIYSFYKKNNVLFCIKTIYNNKSSLINQNKLITKPIFFLVRFWGDLHFLIDNLGFLNHTVCSTHEINKKKIIKILMLNLIKTNFKKKFLLDITSKNYLTKIYFYKLKIN